MPLTLGTDLRFQRQAPAFSATLNPDPTLGEIYEPGALTAGLTIGAPVNPAIGQVLIFSFLQDGTGGRTVTWNAAFIKTWSDTGNGANTRSSVAFYYNGTSWIQIGAQRAWA